MTFRKGQSGNPAGRPRGSKNRYALDRKVRAKLARTGESPLELMLEIMRDPNERMELRLDAAKSAAPFMHRRMPTAVEDTDPNQQLVFDPQALAGLSAEEKIILLGLFEKIGLTLPHQWPAGT